MPAALFLAPQNEKSLEGGREEGIAGKEVQLASGLAHSGVFVGNSLARKTENGV